MLRPFSRLADTRSTTSSLSSALPVNQRQLRSPLPSQFPRQQKKIDVDKRGGVRVRPFSQPRPTPRAAMASPPPASNGTKKPLVYFVTGNQNKLEEVVAILEEASSREGEKPLPCEVRALDVDLPELQGQPQEIAAAKAEAAARVVASREGGGDEIAASAVIVEDTSLCFEALGGLPGPYVKDFLKAIGPEGLPKLLAGFEDERAYAQCVFAFAKVEKVKKAEKAEKETPSTSAAARVFVGRTHGSIARTPRGPRTFGWDCIFVPGDRDGEEGKEVEKNNNPGQLTYAEMPASRKNLISHRRRALDKLRAFLVERYSE